MNSSIDLDRYFERIGYRGPQQPTLELLHAITAAHAQSIPFENLDVLLERPIRLEPEAIFRKLVHEHRGGYCFENNGLLLAVLTQLGFEVRPLSARVRTGMIDRHILAPRTHLVLEVRIDGKLWLTDVGVGSASLTCALRFMADIEQPTPHDTRRLVRADGKWFHQVRHDGQWLDVYEFTGESMPLIDRTVANWYTSTHPDSKFRHNLFAARALANGRRVALLNHELSLRGPDGSVQKRVIATPEKLLDALREHFGIDLPKGARFNLEAAA
ncbi:MAG: arylamine N-acetyltransferase family protein [Gammaproteobacteria bacterium]